MNESLETPLTDKVILPTLKNNLLPKYQRALALQPITKINKLESYCRLLENSFESDDRYSPPSQVLLNDPEFGPSSFHTSTSRHPKSTINVVTEMVDNFHISKEDSSTETKLEKVESFGELMALSPSKGKAFLCQIKIGNISIPT